MKFLPPNRQNNSLVEDRIRNLNGSYSFRITNDLKTELNNVIVNYFQIGKRDYKTTLVSSILEMFIGNLYYYKLRTTKQLGYIVHAGKHIEQNVIVILFKKVLPLSCSKQENDTRSVEHRN